MVQGESKDMHCHTAERGILFVMIELWSHCRGLVIHVETRDKRQAVFRSCYVSRHQKLLHELRLANSLYEKDQTQK